MKYTDSIIFPPGSSPSTLSRSSTLSRILTPSKTSTSLPDFNNPVVPQSTTESSSVRSSFTESFYSECKSEKYVSKLEKPNEITSRRRSKSWKSFTPKKTKKSIFEKNSKFRASVIEFLNKSNPTYSPTSRSPSRLSKLKKSFVEFAKRYKVKKGEDKNLQELNDSPQSSQSQVSNSRKNKTKETSFLNSRNKTNPTSTSTATTTSTTTTTITTTTTTSTTTTTITTTTTTNNKFSPARLSANVEDTQDSKDYNNTKRRLPDLEHL